MEKMSAKEKEKMLEDQVPVKVAPED